MIVHLIAFGLIAALLDRRYNRGRLSRLPFWQLFLLVFSVIMLAHGLTAEGP